MWHVHTTSWLLRCRPALLPSVCGDMYVHASAAVTLALFEPPEPQRPVALAAVQEKGKESLLARYSKPLSMCLALAVLLTLTSLDFFQGSAPKQNCLAMLAFVTVLWCSEAVPLFVTSMLVPLLVVMLRVLNDDTQNPESRMTAQAAATAIFHAMFSQVRCCKLCCTWEYCFDALPVGLLCSRTSAPLAESYKYT